MKKFLLKGSSIVVSSEWLKQNDDDVFDCLMDLIDGEEHTEDYNNGKWQITVEFSEVLEDGSIAISYYAGKDASELNNQPIWLTDSLNMATWLEDYSQPKEYTIEAIRQGVMVEIQEEMDRIGFINDSDLVDRFIDNIIDSKVNGLIGDILEDEYEAYELKEIIGTEVRNNMNLIYKRISELNMAGDFTSFYYDRNIEFSDMEEFYKYFEIGE